MEPASSSVERAGAARPDTGGTRLHRLGRATAGFRGATADCRAGVERARGRGLGRPQDRGAGGPSRAVVVGPRGAARRAGRCATVELAGGERFSATYSVVTTTPGTGRAPT